MTGLESNHKSKFEIKERKKGKQTEASVEEKPIARPASHSEVSIKEFDRELPSETSDEFLEYFTEAIHFYQNSSDEEALQLYVKCIALATCESEELFECYKNSGNIFLRFGDIANAEALYEKAIALKPNSDVVLVNQGTMEMQKGNKELALDRYRSAVQMNPLSEKAWLGLSIIHREYGDIELAWANLDKVLDLNADQNVALDLVFQWGLKDSLYQNIEKHFLNYLEFNPEDDQRRLELAKAYICCIRFSSAREQLKLMSEATQSFGEVSELINLIDSNGESAE